jgi:predicted ATPase
LYQHLTGAHAAGLQTFETFASLVATTNPNAPEAGFHLSISEFFTGRLIAARTRLDRLRDHAKDAKRQTVLYQSDIYIDIDCARCIVEWLTGSPTTAVDTAKSNVVRALKSNHHMSISNALNAALPILYWTGQFDECDRDIAILEEEGQKHGILTRRPIAMFYRAALTCARGEIANGVQLLESVVAEFRAINHLARMPYYLSVLAHTQAQCGRIEEARQTIKIALDMAIESSEGWCLPEVQRVNASILLLDGSKHQAEDFLLRSVALAKEIGAQSWRLRSATDLARIWASNSRTLDASSLLSEVYSEFAEGFDTPDLIAASKLLLSLNAPDKRPRNRSRGVSDASAATVFAAELLRNLQGMAI